jgi:hypothetical protein
MTDLLTDIYLMEGFLMELQPFNPGIQDSLANYYAGLLDKHGVSFQDFEQALACYLLHEREMQLIHEEILQRYSIMESQVEPFMPESQAPVEAPDDRLNSEYREVQPDKELPDSLAGEYYR